MVLDVKTPAPDIGQTYFEISFSGYQEPAVDAAAGPPSHRMVEKAVTDFFKGRAAVLQGVGVAGASVLEVSEPFPEVVTIGSRVASNLQRQALIAFFVAIVAIIFYLSLRFEFVFGLAAIAVLLHDVLVTIGILALTDFFFGEYLSLKINLPEVAALLTIIGYSVNDSIVVFDRIRENLRLAKKNVDFEDLVEHPEVGPASRDGTDPQWIIGHGSLCGLEPPCRKKLHRGIGAHLTAYSSRADAGGAQAESGRRAPQAAGGALQRGFRTHARDARQATGMRLTGGG